MAATHTQSEKSEERDERKGFQLPGMLGRLQAAWYLLRDPEASGLAKLGVVLIGLGGLLFMFAYGISPIDLIPELFTGPIGLIDDVIMVPVVLWVLSRFMPAEKAERLLRKFRSRGKSKAQDAGATGDAHA